MKDMITSFDACPLGVYLDCLAIADDAAREDIDKQVAILALLSGLHERDILNLPIAEYKAMAAAADFLQHPARKVGRPAAKYTLGDFTLIPTQDLRKVTAAQYIDFQTFAPEGDARLVELLSVLLVPEGHAYSDGYDPLDVQTAIRGELRVTDALALVAFFFKSWVKLTRATLASLEREIRSAAKIKDPAKRRELLTRIATTKADLTQSLRDVGDGYKRLTS